MITVHGHILNTHLSGDFASCSQFAELDNDLRDNVAKDLSYRNISGDISQELTNIGVFCASSDLLQYISVKSTDAVWRGEAGSIHFTQSGAYGHDYSLEVNVDLNQIIAEKYVGR